MPELWPWGIAATCFGVAMAATLKTIGDAHSLKRANEEITVLKEEIARLKIIDGEHKKATSDDFTNPLHYPKILVS